MTERIKFGDKKHNITHLFFDLGSTLLDESEAVKTRVERTVTRLQSIGRACSLDTFWVKMEDTAQYEAHPYSKVMEQFQGVAWEAWPKELEIMYPDVPDILRALSRQYVLGVIANQSSGTIERLEQFGILQYFNVVASSAELGMAKPDPRMFKWALEQVKCSPRNAVMVGDRIDNDILPAKALGMRTVWVKQGWGGKFKIVSDEQKPDFEIDRIGDLIRVLEGGWLWIDNDFD